MRPGHAAAGLAHPGRAALPISEGREDKAQVHTHDTAFDIILENFRLREFCFFPPLCTAPAPPPAAAAEEDEMAAPRLFHPVARPVAGYWLPVCLCRRGPCPL